MDFGNDRQHALGLCLLPFCLIVSSSRLAHRANVKSMFGTIFPRWQALPRGCVTQRSEMVGKGEAVALDAEQICNREGQLRLGQEDCGELLDVASNFGTPGAIVLITLPGSPGRTNLETPTKTITDWNSASGSDKRRERTETWCRF